MYMVIWESLRGAAKKIYKFVFNEPAKLLCFGEVFLGYVQYLFIFFQQAFAHTEGSWQADVSLVLGGKWTENCTSC